MRYHSDAPAIHGAATNIDLAERRRDGLMHFTADVRILAPVDHGRGNQRATTNPPQARRTPSQRAGRLRRYPTARNCSHSSRVCTAMVDLPLNGAGCQSRLRQLDLGEHG